MEFFVFAFYFFISFSSYLCPVHFRDAKCLPCLQTEISAIELLKYLKPLCFKQEIGTQNL